MLNYINKIKNNLENINKKIATEENNFKRIDLNVEKKNLEDQFNFCLDLVFKTLTNNDLLNIAKQYISNEKIEYAEQEAKNYNTIVIDVMIERNTTQKKITLQNISNILSKNPNIENDEYKETKEYENLQTYRKNIIQLDKMIEDDQKKKKTFISYLSDEDKIALVDIILEKHINDEKEKENLLNVATEYKPILDLSRDARYPLTNRFKELTENKDNSLAKYLLENEESIKRLTVISNNNSLSYYYSTKVTKIEYHLGENRVREFINAAKKNNIDDIIDPDLGQFKARKIYYNNENYNRFKSQINEIKSTNENKEKIKKLLRKLDSLEILDSNANASESPYKEYGFIRFLSARQDFINAMNENPINEEKIKDTFENLKKEEAKIYEMYKMIKEELGDDYDNMPSNVDSFRNIGVPPCFKDNLAINAKFNSLFIMLTMIKEKNLDIDTFVEHPIVTSSEAFQESFKKANLDLILKDKTKGEAILFLSNRKPLPGSEDLVKYSRSFELICNSEKNEEFKEQNNLSMIAFTEYNRSFGRAVNIALDYFSYKYSESLQNIFMAKKDEEGKISYLDCYIANSPIQDNLTTSLAYDEKATIVEKIKADENIENTFYETLETLKYFATNKKNSRVRDNVTLNQDKMFYAVQEFAAKIILTLDLKGNSKDLNKGYSEKFVTDLFNIIDDYKQIDDLKGFKFRENINKVNTMIAVIKNRDNLVKNFEKSMNNDQKIKEDKFVEAFEKINKEIDRLDEQADKIGKKIGKGLTNKEIEDIAVAQQRKFIELQNLQNSRIEELKEDVKEGKISKFYFEKRSEQIKLLNNIKEKPAMFMCDDKNYKDFKTYAKKVLNKNIKEFNADELREAKENHTLLMKKSVEEKRLYILNSVLHANKLGMSKSINYEKVEKIVINDHTEEMQKISNEILEQNQKDLEKNQSINNAKIAIDVNIVEEIKINNNEQIKEEIKEINKELS